MFGIDCEGGSYIECLDKKKPHAAILEEVPGFLIASTGERSGYERFVEEVGAVLDFDGQALYHPDAIKCVILNAATWLDIQRERVYIVMLSKHVGGVAAMARVVKMLTEMTAYRSTFSPHKIGEFLEKCGAKDEEVDRVAAEAP
jgi:hypothetical protein